MSLTKVVHTVDEFQVLYWTDGGMQNGYLFRDTKDGTETYLYCDSEGAEYVEHVMQLGRGDARAEIDDALRSFRKGTQP